MSEPPPIESARRGRRFQVHGRVQGVGFRWWTRTLAGELGVRGTVRNLPDGTVEVRAAGSDEQLDRLAAALRQGPPGAQVERLDAEACEPPSESGFAIGR